MAFAAASKRAPLAGLLKKLLLPAPSASTLRPASVAAARSFFTGGSPFRRYDDDEESSGDEDVAYDYDRRGARDSSDSVFIFPDDVAGPFSEPTKLDRLLALMEEDELVAPPPPRRGGWVSKEDDDAVQIKVAMPGLGKEHLKVWADEDGLVIKGEGDKDTDDDEGPARYTRRIDLCPDAFKLDQIKAEMKDGVLKVTLPKVKVEERKDVFQVKVE